MQKSKTSKAKTKAKLYSYLTCVFLLVAKFARISGTEAIDFKEAEDKTLIGIASDSKKICRLITSNSKDDSQFLYKIDCIGIDDKKLPSNDLNTVKDVDVEDFNVVANSLKKGTDKDAIDKNVTGFDNGKYTYDDTAKHFTSNFQPQLNIDDSGIVIKSKLDVITNKKSEDIAKDAITKITGTQAPNFEKLIDFNKNSVFNAWMAFFDRKPKQVIDLSGFKLDEFVLLEGKTNVHHVYFTGVKEGKIGLYVNSLVTAEGEKELSKLEKDDEIKELSVKKKDDKPEEKITDPWEYGFYNNDKFGANAKKCEIKLEVKGVKLEINYEVKGTELKDLVGKLISESKVTEKSGTVKAKDVKPWLELFKKDVADDGEDGLAGWAVGLIIVGVVILLALIGVGVWWYMRNSENKL